MTISDLTISDLEVGQEIEYTVLRNRNRTHERKGKIKQITPRFITVSLARWNDTIGIQDINPENPEVGSVLIPALKKGGQEVQKEARIDWKTLWPQVEARLEHGLSYSIIADELDIPYERLNGKICYEKTKRAKVANITSADVNILPSESSPDASLNHGEGDRLSDQLKIAPGPNLDLPGLKLELIATIMNRGKAGNCPDKNILHLISQVNAMELPEATS